jgi:acyl-CoA thioester hydrolase
MNKQKKISTDIVVRFRDIDSMGHVNNAVFLTYFEEGRKAFLSEVLDIVNPADYPFILAHIDCDFMKPVRLGDNLTLFVWIGEIGEKSFAFKYQLADRNTTSVTYGKGESVMVYFDYRTNRTIPIPGDFLEKISPYSEQST